MNLDDYDYHLPKERIAQSAIHPKSYSKMLIINKNKEYQDKRFYNILDYLQKDDVLVINETKVINAKLCGKKETNSKVEIIILKKIDNQYICKIKGRNPNKGKKMIFPENLIAQIIEKVGESFILKFNKELTDSYLKKYAELPTPPYIKEKLKQKKDYQTVFASKEGSLAAPTAGLHFTTNLIRKIKKKGIKIAKVCLHVSFGTFSPIKNKDFTKHQMEPEYVIINKENSDIINNRKGRLFVIGTTTLKALETATDKKGIIYPISKYSEKYIYPGYKFSIKPEGFLTNFHLPKSTLILLISALYSKKTIFKAYKYAIENKYRFYSLGDSMLLLKN